MSLPYHPTIRPAIGGYVVSATTAAGTELLWGPYPKRADAEAVAQRLTVALIDDRASELRRAKRKPTAGPAQQTAFNEEHAGSHGHFTLLADCPAARGRNRDGSEPRCQTCHAPSTCSHRDGRWCGACCPDEQAVRQQRAAQSTQPAHEPTPARARRRR